MRRLKIYDTQFAHGTALGSGDLKIYPTDFVWTRGNDANVGSICVVSESCFDQVKSIRELHKVGLIIEPVSISGKPYAQARRPEFNSQFDFILTHNQALIDTNPDKFVFYPFIGCWIEQADRNVYPKSKNISIVASDKRITQWHNLRHEVIAKYRHRIDGIFGRGYNFVQYKLDALRDYRFQIVIENERSRHWFTEKLIDCLVTGTIPIYCGDDDIGQFYNADGIIQFSNAEELGSIIDRCTPEEYERRLPAVMDNFERAKKHGSLPDNYIFDVIKERFKL
jgi:hypothetical protein